MNNQIDKIGQNNANGMLTSIWGQSMWHSLHCVSFTYPDNPTDDDKNNYKKYFEILKFVLPCCACRNHYNEHTQINGDHQLTDLVFENKTSLTKWVYELHEKVNKSLGMNYDITYDDICLKYETFIAKCNMTQEDKTIAYKNFYNNEAPLITYEKAILFNEYAKSRGLHDFEEKLNKTYQNFQNKRLNQVASENWMDRNQKCNELLKYMRINNILGFEKNNQHHNLPTIQELQMFQMMSTTLCEKTLDHMIKKLNKLTESTELTESNELTKLNKSNELNTEINLDELCDNLSNILNI